MNQKDLLEQVKQAIHDIEPDAEVILYGSRTREVSNAESDWDFLVLVNGTVDDERIDKIRHRLYEIEWECGEILSSIVRSRKDWNSIAYKRMPFHQNVELEGIVL